MTLKEAVQEYENAQNDMMQVANYNPNRNHCTDDEYAQLLRMRTRAIRQYIKAMGRAFEHGVLLDMPTVAEQVQEVS